jgi:hypothetical protein
MCNPTINSATLRWHHSSGLTFLLGWEEVKDGKGVALGWGMVGREINDPAIARMPPTRHQGMALHPARCNKTQSNQQATNNKPKKYV